jgi:hypothetical protein
MWLTIWLDSTYIRIVDPVAQVSIAFTALTTCIMFSIHFIKAYSFLRRQASIN